MNNKTVITKTIDGIEVVSGFGTLAMNPIETRNAGALAIQTTAEFIAVKVKQDAANESLRKAGEESKKYKSASNKTDKDKAWKAADSHRNIAEGIENEIKALIPALKKKQKEVRQSAAVYFEPKAGETVKSDAEILALRDSFESVQGSGYVDIDGNILNDNRGVIYCQEGAEKWGVAEIRSIGVNVPTDAILYADLDATQKKAVDLQVEIDRAARMSGGEKTLARQFAEGKALTDAASMRSQLEIQSVPDALEQSQGFYDDRMAEIDMIYG